MSPSQTSAPSTGDQPLFLDPSNYEILKTRVEATLDGKHLLGFVRNPNYDGCSDGDDEDFDEDVRMDSEDDVEAYPTAPAPDAITAPATADQAPDATPTPSAVALPPILSFTEQRKADTTKAKRTAAKRRFAVSAKTLRHCQVRAKTYLLSTLDNIHVLLVRDNTTAYAIYQTIRERYEDKALYGDPYYIQSFLMELKYEEGTDLTLFSLRFEQTLQASSAATNSSLSDEQKSINLYHAMPPTWRNDLQILKGTRKFIPYAELKHNIEQKVRDELVKSKYIIHKGSPESREMRAETALKADAPPSPAPTAFVSGSPTCTYCQRDNHVTRDCRTLQRDLLGGTIKAGTVIPDNFVVNIPNRLRQPPTEYCGSTYRGRDPSSGRRRYGGGRGTINGGRGSYQLGRGHYGGNAPRRNHDSDEVAELFDRFGNSVNVPREQVTFQTRKTSRNDYAVITITMADTTAFSLTATACTSDPIWTSDSGCIRHVSAVKDWFTDLVPSTGSITIGGKHEIPIEGSGTIRLAIGDANGKQREIQLGNVLYASQLRFNLFSVPCAARSDFKITFDPKMYSLFYASSFKLCAPIAERSGLYQFRAAPASPETSKDITQAQHEALVATTGHE